MADVLLKRKWAGSSVVPVGWRQHYTEGQQAALAVIITVARSKGDCRLSYAEIGRAAGVGRDTVQSAVRQGVALGHLMVRRRTDEGESNVVTVCQ